MQSKQATQVSILPLDTGSNETQDNAQQEQSVSSTLKNDIIKTNIEPEQNWKSVSDRILGQLSQIDGQQQIIPSKQAKENKEKRQINQKSEIQLQQEPSIKLNCDDPMCIQQVGLCKIEKSKSLQPTDALEPEIRNVTDNIKSNVQNTQVLNSERVSKTQSLINLHNQLDQTQLSKRNVMKNLQISSILTINKINVSDLPPTGKQVIQNVNNLHNETKQSIDNSNNISSSQNKVKQQIEGMNTLINRFVKHYDEAQQKIQNLDQNFVKIDAKLRNHDDDHESRTKLGTKLDVTIIEDNKKHINQITVISGEIQNAKSQKLFTGIGEIKIYSGEVFKGDILNNEMTGCAICSQNGMIKYAGEWLKGQWHGLGKQYEVVNFDAKLKTGKEFLRRYGCFDQNKLNGIGQMYYYDGSSYSGEWKDDEWFGQGIFIWESGAILELSTTTDKCNIILQFKDSSKIEGSLLQFETEISVNDKLSNILQFENGDGVYQYDGQKLSCISGQYKQVYQTGNIYQGNWVNSEWKGKGTYTWQSGAVLTSNNSAIELNSAINATLQLKTCKNIECKSVAIVPGENLVIITGQHDDKYEFDGKELKIFQGEFEIVYSNQNKYNGQWKSNFWNGEGVFTWKSSAKLQSSSFRLIEQKQIITARQATLFLKDGKQLKLCNIEMQAIEFTLSQRFFDGKCKMKLQNGADSYEFDGKNMRKVGW